MTESSKAIVSAIVIVACLALLGALAMWHVEGAAVAAIAAVTTIVAWLTRPPERKDPPGGQGVVLAATLIAIIVAACAACTGAQSPREQSRSVVLTIAEGVRTADQTCASIARATSSLDLAKTCAQYVTEAREALLTAEQGVDAVDDASAERVPCAVRDAASALSRVLNTIRSAGGHTPPAADDALRLAPMLTGACHA